MRTINYKEELKAYCQFDDLHSGNCVATFLRTEIRPDNQIAWIYFCEDCQVEEERLYDAEEDYVYIGSCPVDENPFPELTSLVACRAFIIQLQNTYTIPHGGRLQIKAEYGGGGYYEVIAIYDNRWPESVAWALYLEGNTPERWSPKAKEFLKSK